MEVSWGVLQFYLDRGHFGPSLKNLTRLKQKLTVTAGKSGGSAIKWIKDRPEGGTFFSVIQGTM